MDNFPARPKPWTWDVSPDGTAYAIFDVNGNTLLTIKDEHLDREQDLDEIVKCVNEQEQLRSQVEALEQENKQLRLIVQQATPFQPVAGSDQELKKELEEKIIRLELYRFELHQITEQIRVIEQHAAELKREGQPISYGEKLKQEQLSLAWDAKTEEIQKAFPNVDLPFALQEELEKYCQVLVEVNKRLKGYDEPPPVQERVLSYKDHYQQSIRQKPQRKPLQDHEQERGR